jgi:hypothetical protein
MCAKGKLPLNDVIATANILYTPLIEKSCLITSSTLATELELHLE